jgi:hypothetical protein
MPVMEASMKFQNAEHLPAKGEKGYTLDDPQKFYVVSITGLRMPGGGRGRRQQEGSADQEGGAGDQRSSMDRMKDQLMGSTRIFRKGHDPIVPADIKFITANNVVIFLFPKNDAISDDDKDVEFRTALGPIQIKEKFALKDMHFNGKLAL